MRDMAVRGGIVQHLHRTFECRFEVETAPSFSKIPRFRNRPVPEDRSRITDGYDVILPVRHEFPHSGNHPFRCQRRPGIKLAMSVLARSRDLDVSSTDIDNQHVHDKFASPHLPLSFTFLIAESIQSAT